MGKWFIARRADKAILPAVKAFWAFTLKEGHRHLRSFASADPGSG
jgi:hypothetical protein